MTAEKNGLITQLDMYVCEAVCREIRRCIDLGLAPIPISINISRLDFDDMDLAKNIAQIAERYDIDKSLLHVELTETAYSEDPDAVVRALTQLHANGFKIELDDFGSGYSSLASLNMLPLDILKLDGSMIRQATKLNDFRIVQSAIQLANASTADRKRSLTTSRTWDATSFRASTTHGRCVKRTLRDISRAARASPP